MLKEEPELASFAKAFEKTGAGESAESSDKAVEEV
jgi:hypothetical protein